MFAGLAPARRRAVLGILAVVAVAVIVLGIVLLLPRQDRPTTDQARPGPVLLVPGYGGSSGSLQSLAARLQRVGRDATVVDLPGDGTGDLAAAAVVLATTAGAALDRTGALSVDVVGYSAGGVVARLWAADSSDGLIRRVVTLGSPQHGTTVADLADQVVGNACPEACRQLTTDSDLLRRLNAGDETPAGATWVSIWTGQDETVTPPDSARLAGALNLTVQSVCPDAVVSHGDLPRDPLVQAMVVAELQPGEPVALTAADCGRLRLG